MSALSDAIAQSQPRGACETAQDTPPFVAGQLGLALLSLLLAVPAAADPATSPAGQPAQWIVVGVPAANATTGTLRAFQRVGQQWKVVLGPTPAKVGELGISEPLTVSTALPWERSRSTKPSVASPIQAPRCPTSRPPTRTGQVQDAG